MKLCYNIVCQLQLGYVYLSRDPQFIFQIEDLKSVLEFPLEASSVSGLLISNYIICPMMYTNYLHCKWIIMKSIKVPNHHPLIITIDAYK